MKMMMLVVMVLTLFAMTLTTGCGGGGGGGGGIIPSGSSGGNAPAQNWHSGGTEGTAGDAGSAAASDGSTTPIMSLSDPKGLNNHPESWAVPEPLGLLLLGLGVVGLAGLRRKLQT